MASRGDRVQCAIGRAGSGKTTTMRVAASAWNAAGYRVIGAAIKGEAARQLAADAGIEAETVAMLLARSRAGARVLDSRTVLIVDEASTLGDRDLLALCEVAIETGATVRLIGDTAQHSSVATGVTFAELAERDDGRAPRLSRFESWVASVVLEIVGSASSAGRWNQRNANGYGAHRAFRWPLPPCPHLAPRRSSSGC